MAATLRRHSEHMDTPALRPASRLQLSWLRRELADWQAAGIVDAEQVTAITTRYRVEEDRGARFSLGRILLALGGAFVGVGLIWLVAANLDELSPLVRFLVVAVLWLLFLLGAEALTVRTRSHGLVGAVRLMAALAFGATVFQAAQSLQVPAYEPRLVGVWAAGALLHAYGVRALMPLLVGLVTGSVWWVWQPLWDSASAAGAMAALGAAAVLGTSVAVLHDGRDDRFAFVWRSVGAGFALVTLFMAAVPAVTTDDFEWTAWLVVALVVAALAAVAAVVLGRGTSRWEPLGAAAVLGVSTLLVLWDTGTSTDVVGAADWAHASVSVAVYVLVAVAVAALGTLRDNPLLTGLAMVGLVAFTTFQSFAVFAPIVTGAWLFVVLGVVFLGTGLLFDRARRGLAASLDTDSPEGASR